MLTAVLFAVLALVWGSNFIYMKLAAELISPSQIVLLRVVFGFIPVLIYALLKKEFKIKHIKYIGHFFVMSLLATSVYYYAFAKGTTLLFSGIAGVLSALIPMFSFILALVFLAEEKVSAVKVLGIALGFIGVFFIANPLALDITVVNVEGVLYMVLGSFSVGASFVYAKKYITPLNIPATALTTYQLGLSLLLLFVLTDKQGIGAVFGDLHIALGLVLGLGILGTGLAYILYYQLIKKMGAVSASSATYLPPIVALIIGVVIVGEPIVWLDYVATILILLGVILVNKKSVRV